MNKPAHPTHNHRPARNHDAWRGLEELVRQLIPLTAAAHRVLATAGSTEVAADLARELGTLRIPAIVGELRRGPKWLRQLANRNRLSVAVTRDGFDLSPMPASEPTPIDNQEE